MHPALVEQWVEYSVGMCFFFLRFFARFMVVGYNGLQLDDLFAFIAMLLYTVDSACVQIITDHGSNVGLNEQSAMALSDEQAHSYEIGSRTLFIGWLSYVSMIWAMKATLLFFYSRLTLGTWQQKLVKIMGVACIVSYCGVILTLFLHCTPIQKNWQVKPYAGDKCTLTTANYVVVAVFNVLTDMGILSIPIPLIWKVKIPLRRKIIIALLLSSGLFVITAAILRCVLTLSNIRNIGNSTSWALRETFVAVISVSAPAIKPLFNKSRWLGSSNDKQGGSSGYGKGFRRFGQPSVTEIVSSDRRPTTAATMKGGLDLEVGSWKGGSSESDVELKDLSRTGSQERIVDSGSRTGNRVPALEINVTQMYALANKESTHTEMVETEGTMPFKTEQWGLNTEITAGPQSAGAKKSGKAAKMMGFIRRDSD